MNYRYTQKDIKIIDMSNANDWMYNWIRKHSGRVKPDDVTTDETNDSGSNKNNKDNETNTNPNHIQSNEYSSKDTDTK
jgi:hypothetical protein